MDGRVAWAREMGSNMEISDSGDDKSRKNSQPREDPMHDQPRENMGYVEVILNLISKAESSYRGIGPIGEQ